MRTNQFKLNIRKVNLLRLFGSVKKQFEFQAQQKSLNFDLNVLPGVPDHIISDEDRLIQVLCCLIGNAVKFTYQGGITIIVAPDDSDQSQDESCGGNNPKKLLISVEDTGIGIP